jgi:hypothetical protein
VPVALQLQAPPATNLAGCTEVNGRGINHKYVPGTGLLLDLVAMLITDVHMRNGPQVRQQNLLPGSGARFSSRHCKGAPATPFPPLQMTSVITSPINCFAPVEYWILAKQANPVGRPAVDWNLMVLQSALRHQSQYKFLRHVLALRYDQFNRLF